MPDRSSAKFQWMVTSSLYQPSALALLVAAPLIRGDVLSMLMPVTWAVAWLSATLSAVPLTDWLAPSPLSVVSDGQLLMPESASEQLKLTDTSELFQPLAFGAGVRAPLMLGGSLSTWTLTDPIPMCPSQSVAFADTVVTPLVVRVVAEGCGPIASPVSPASALQVRVTSVLFQPALLGAGESVPITAGGVLSRTRFETPAVPNSPRQFAWM